SCARRQRARALSASRRTVRGLHARARLRAPRVFLRSRSAAPLPFELRMTDDLTEACRRALDEALAAGGTVTAGTASVLAATPTAALEAALRDLADAHGAAA